eukprot:GDKI01017505.1.p1 GENE.GDKI01017505.1~~GDKI01017505.1.p1  ORF type:complete len:262 (-),score=15.94 GDKI01017505.1:340-1125(-)
MKSCFQFMLCHLGTHVILRIDSGSVYAIIYVTNASVLGIRYFEWLPLNGWVFLLKSHPGALLFATVMTRLPPHIGQLTLEFCDFSLAGPLGQPLLPEPAGFIELSMDFRFCQRCWCASLPFVYTFFFCADFRKTGKCDKRPREGWVVHAGISLSVGDAIYAHNQRPRVQVQRQCFVRIQCARLIFAATARCFALSIRIQSARDIQLHLNAILIRLVHFLISLLSTCGLLLLHLLRLCYWLGGGLDILAIVGQLLLESPPPT